MDCISYLTMIRKVCLDFYLLSVVGEAARRQEYNVRCAHNMQKLSPCTNLGNPSLVDLQIQRNRSYIRAIQVLSTSKCHRNRSYKSVPLDCPLKAAPKSTLRRVPLTRHSIYRSLLPPIAMDSRWTIWSPLASPRFKLSSTSIRPSAISKL
jgi:hypothetical protein